MILGVLFRRPVETYAALVRATGEVIERYPSQVFTIRQKSPVEVKAVEEIVARHSFLHSYSLSSTE